MGGAESFVLLLMACQTYYNSDHIEFQQFYHTVFLIKVHI